MEVFGFVGSKDVYGPEVDLFNLPPTNMSVVDTDYERLFPTTSVKGNTSNTIRFRIGRSDSFLDLKESFVYIKARILKADGSQLLDTDKIAPGNLFLHTLFENVNVKFNDKIVSSSNFMYPYRAWLKNQFKVSAGSKESELSKEVYYKDTDPDDYTTNNPGFSQRLALAAGSKPFEMIGKISEDIFDQQRFITNTVDVDIEFSRSNPNFCLSGEEVVGENEYRVEIEDMQLFVKRRTLDPDLFDSIQKNLSRGKKAKYPLSRTEMRTALISKGMLDYINPSLFNGTIPQFMCVGIVSAVAYSGRLNKSPFNFKNNNLTKLAITVNGKPVLYKTLECDFKNGEYLLAYNTLFGKNESKNGNGISMAEYLKGNTLFAYDFGLTMPKELRGERKGTVGLEMSFSEPLEEHQRLIIMTTFQGVVEIDKNGNVELVY